MKESTSKEKMLKKIRKALLEQRDNPYPHLADTSFYEEYTGSLTALFAEQLVSVAGQFIFCKNEIQFAKYLLAISEEKFWHQIYCLEPSIQMVLNTHKISFYDSDSSFMEAEIGITSCEALIARSGSVLISNANASGRRLSIYPNLHVVFAYTSQLLLDLKDGIKLISEKYRTCLPSMVSNITGPSRTADIEKTLVLGAHGPKELIVFLVDKAPAHL